MKTYLTCGLLTGAGGVLAGRLLGADIATCLDWFGVGLVGGTLTTAYVFNVLWLAFGSDDR